MFIGLFDYKNKKMKAKTAKLLLTKMIMKWQSTPQLFWQREFQRRQLLKAFSIYKIMKKREKQKNQRRFWVRLIFNDEQRRLQRASDNLIREMQYIDMEKYIEYLRMDISTFDELLRLIGSKIEKQHVIRSPISARTRLEICLRYLASGDNMASNVQPSPIDGFMLRLAEGMRRLPYRERSKLKLKFLMKLRETEERLGLLDNN